MQITLTFDPATLTDEDRKILSAMTGITTQTTTVTTPAAPKQGKPVAKPEPVVEDEAVEPEDEGDDEDEADEPEPEPEPVKPAPKKRAAAKKAAPKPEVDPSDDEDDADDADTATVRASCEAALLARLGTGGPEARTEVREILATVGARRLSEVSDEDLPRLLTALQA